MREGGVRLPVRMASSRPAASFSIQVFLGRGIKSGLFGCQGIYDDNQQGMFFPLASSWVRASTDLSVGGFSVTVIFSTAERGV
jgi:hypothetical protein